MEVVLHIAPGRPGRAAVGLHPAVGEDDLRGYDGGVGGEAVEIGNKVVDDGHRHERVVIDNEAVFAGYLFERQVVVLCETSELAAFGDLDFRPVRLQAREVFLREHVSDHPDLIGDGGMGADAFQARI